MKERLKVPKLRFKEFSGEWEEYKNRIDIISGNSYPLTSYSNNGVLLIQGLNIYSGVLNIDNPIYISEQDETNHMVIQEGDILLGLNRPITNNSLKLCLYNRTEKAYLYQRAGILKLDRTNLSSLFLYQYLRSDIFLRKLTGELVGSDQPYIKSDLFKRTSNIFPSLPEQQKIADFLSLVDEKIEKLTKKKELLEQYKKGIMQKIFSQEIRFKDDNGNDFPEWEEKELGEVLFEHKTKNNENKYTEVFSVAKSKGVINQIEHLGRSYASDKIDNYGVVFPNDIVYTKSPTSDFPFGIIKQNKTERTGVVSVLYGIFRPISKEIGYLLDEYFSNWKNTYNYLNPIVQKGAKNTMSISNDKFLKGAKILLPSSNDESKKIAEFLSALDKKIDIVDRELAGVQKFKKGLLQQMFV